MAVNERKNKKNFANIKKVGAKSKLYRCRERFFFVVEIQLKHNCFEKKGKQFLKCCLSDRKQNLIKISTFD